MTFKHFQVFANIISAIYMHIYITDMHWQYFDQKKKSPQGLTNYLEDKTNPKGKHKAGSKHVS